MKNEEEPDYSNSEDIMTTFHIFTKDGIHVPLEEPEQKDI